MIPAKRRPPPGYPGAYVADVQRPDVFDPALRHLRNAFVKGAPIAPDRAGSLALARAALLGKVLEALSRGALRESFIVRGSTAMERWFPGWARLAQDLDLIVRDPTIPPDCDLAQRLLLSVKETVCAALAAAEVAHSAHHASVDSIWTYERAEGRRVAVPWMFRGTLDVIQVDVVFQETVQSAPERTVLPGAGANEGWVWFATMAESLAWKLLWLEEDTYPQGKDLYDAVLLAGLCKLPLELLRSVFSAKGSTWAHGTETSFCRRWRIDRDTFAKQYPHLAVESEGLVEKLEELLRIE